MPPRINAPDLIGTLPRTLADERATLDAGAALAAAMTPGTSLHLSGELGAGKTTLCRGILGALGFDERVKSPTYSLVETYETGGLQVHHFDLYRLGPGALEDMGARDYWDNAAICIVEWPERGAGWLPPPRLWLHLDICDDSGGRVLRAGGG